MFKRLPVWLVLLFALFGFLLTIAFANVAIHTFKGGTKAGVIGNVVLTAANLPDLMDRLTASESYLRVSGDFHEGKQGFAFSYDGGTRPDAGYLLLSRYDGDASRSVIEFWDLDQQELIHTWVPPIDEIHAASQNFHSQEIDLQRDRTQRRTLIRHPIVTPEGDVLIKSRSPLTRLDACSRIKWVNDDHLFHHGVQQGRDGIIWTASKFDPPSVEYVRKDTFLDDSIIGVSAADGHVTLKRSVTDLMLDQNLVQLLYLHGEYSDDPVHLNDVEPVFEDGPFWKRGDLFLSLRNPSLILLYRPSTDTIVWHKQGPWSHQHDVDVLDDHRISVFDNHSYTTPGGNRVDPFDERGGHSDIAVYDFETDTVSYPWTDVLDQLEMTSATEGLHTILPNGGLFIEEQNRARLFMLNPDNSLAWEYVNRAENGGLYRTGWSRSIEPQAGAKIAQSLRATTCAD